MDDQPIPSSEPLLRTLSPALGELEKRLRTWLSANHRYPLSTLQKATLEGVAGDLHRQAEALQLDKPLLVVMLMGGTGVGKSTLLNALAGGAIAQASFARPTTRDPVVYYPESIQPSRLDPALRLCKLVSHDRPALEQKIIVDTPDLDSNDLANREKLFQLLPVADIVLYVGSQEKYHDRLGWDLFLHQRKRRAFAFVLNKWDRCQFPGTGRRPDEDLLHDLEAEGFQNPLLFRTCAQHWVDHPLREWGVGSGDRGDESRETRDERREENTISPPPTPRSPLPAPHSPLSTPHSPPVEGEQFLELVRWLELGLNRLEIEAIKARGVSQLFRQFQQALEAVCPPDLNKIGEQTRGVWKKILAEEAHADASVLLNTLEPYQKEIEHHFALDRQRQFRGLMAGYLQLFHKLKYTGSNLRDHIPFLPRLSLPLAAPRSWALASFTQACSKAASEQHLDARTRALANRLLLEAEGQGFPIQLLSEPTEGAAQLDWRNRHAQAMIDVLGQVETTWSRPTGLKRLVQALIIFLADWLPPSAFFIMITLILWVLVYERRTLTGGLVGDLLLPLVVMVLVVVILHLLIALLLPLRWQAIRAEFEGRLERRLLAEMDKTYCQIPEDIAHLLLQERREVEQLLGEIREVAGWLEKREQSASILGLYGR